MTIDPLLVSSSPEVSSALESGQPVVALESTIITHGMPFPRNLETARAVEMTVRQAGAIPATTAVLDGEVRVGLSIEELEALARATSVLKLSRADLLYAAVADRTGSTTVAATMMIAHKAGIRVFATGGIGGVHRGADQSFDISADLTELAKTPVCVVAAGAKALLDLPKTIEVLETYGVPVVGFRTEELPAFWSRASGLQVPFSLSEQGEIADLLHIRDAWGGHGGELIANPVPEAAEIPIDQMAPIIEAAIARAERQQITGKDVTPFVLQEIVRTTEGRSLETNIALVLNNARLAAEIAVAYAAKRRSGSNC